MYYVCAELLVGGFFIRFIDAVFCSNIQLYSYLIVRSSGQVTISSLALGVMCLSVHSPQSEEKLDTKLVVRVGTEEDREKLRQDLIELFKWSDAIQPRQVRCNALWVC